MYIVVIYSVAGPPLDQPNRGPRQATNERWIESVAGGFVDVFDSYSSFILVVFTCNSRIHAFGHFPKLYKLFGESSASDLFISDHYVPAIYPVFGHL